MSSRTLTIALALSLIGNLFLGGALLGGAAWLKARSGTIAAGSLRIAGSELSRPERRGFRIALREARRSVRPVLEDGRRARAEAAALLRQPVLDQAALDAALARVRSDDLAVRTAVEQPAVAFAASLKPDDRARLADAMVRRNERRPTRN